MPTAPRGTGLVCDLLFDDMVGHFATNGLQFFRDADGSWFQIEPAKRGLYAGPINWRPSYVHMTPERRSLIRNRAATGRTV
jgi:hypothetical protein